LVIYPKNLFQLTAKQAVIFCHLLWWLHWSNTKLFAYGTE